MNFKLNEECRNSKKKEFYYGAKLNKDIKDVYLGVVFLEPKEQNRKLGPGRGHEELLYVVSGKIEIHFKKTQHQLNEGEVMLIPDKTKVRVSNLTDAQCHLVIAGGHVKHHEH